MHLRNNHIADYQSLFNRLELNIANGLGNNLPTDTRLSAIEPESIDNYITELQYQFGRYLLISSSRPGTLPANLQGIWADGLEPPWNADYHMNINVQMNYWMAEMANLAELHVPLGILPHLLDGLALVCGQWARLGAANICLPTMSLPKTKSICATMPTLL